MKNTWFEVLITINLVSMKLTVKVFKFSTISHIANPSVDIFENLNANKECLTNGKF